jgi:hypothetical protein
VTDLTCASREELLEIIAQQQAQIAALLVGVEELEAQVQQLQEEIGRLRSGKGGGVEFAVKASRPPREEKKERKHRAQAFVRRREKADEVRYHRLERCPDCGAKLTGEGWEHRRHQVIELELRRRVVDHVVLGRRCGVCGKRALPKLEDKEIGAVGKRRFGASVQSLVTVLNVAGRLPIRMIRRMLRETCGLHLSSGAVVDLLDGVRAAAEPTVRELRAQVRASASVCADETGWREDGVNGYLWTFSTSALRCYEYRPSRSGQVPLEVLGENFGGTVTCDFYAAYNKLGAVLQRCWPHLLRDAKDLAEINADRPEVAAWREALKALYLEAKTFHHDNPRKRTRARRYFEARTAKLAQPYANDRAAPQRTLAQRILKHLHELFVFVSDPEVPGDNNLAERSLRPAVIARKISGGTRSPKGSETKMKLMSLLGTWQAQGKPLHATCQQLLLSSPARSP